jgi:hypothetical protein
VLGRCMLVSGVVPSGYEAKQYCHTTLERGAVHGGNKLGRVLCFGRLVLGRVGAKGP